MSTIRETKRASAVRLALAGLLALAAVVWLAVNREPPAHAATITVTTTTDVNAEDGLCSLREAITAANTDEAAGGCPAGSGPDEIIVPAGNYILAIPGANENQNLGGDLDIINDLTIAGAGESSTVIDGNTIDSVFHVVSGVATVSDLTIRNGRRGVLNEGALSLIRSTVADNTLWSSSSTGGAGIYNAPGAAITITDSTVSGNTATAAFAQGGGVWIDEGSAGATITGSTISGNTSSGEGGGVTVGNESCCGGGTAYLTISNSTISGNTASSTGAGVYVVTNLHNWPHSVRIDNSTISSNQGGRRTCRA